MANDFLSNQQASNVGGANNSPGATGENTFQNFKEKQLIILIKPGKDDGGFGDSMAAAGGMISSVTSKIDSAVSAIESVAESIPGLDLFIKEKKKDSQSEKEYCTDFKAWETALKDQEKKAKEILSENKSTVFGFSASTESDIKSEAEKLKDKILDQLSDWKDYTTWVHLIGVDQGGNVLNECSKLLAKDSEFMSQKWLIKSAFYVGTPTYKNKHLFDTHCLKGKGKQFSVVNKFDLTDQVIACFEPNTDLVKYITNSNSNLLKMTIAKIKMRVIKIIASLLKGVTIGTGAGVVEPIKKLVDTIKDEISGLIEDVKSMIEEILDGVKDLIDLSGIPDIKQFTEGFGKIPDECKKILSAELDDLMKKIEKGAKSANLEVGLSDLTKFFNCLCPLVDHLSAVFENMNLNKEAQKKLAQAVLDKVKINKVHALKSPQGLTLDISTIDPYTEKVNESLKEKKPDQVKTFIASLQALLNTATNKHSELAQMNDQEKEKIADLVYRLTYPMLTSKKEFIEKLISFISGLVNLKEMMKDITLSSLAATAGGALQKLYLSFPPEKLNVSIKKFDQEFDRVKNFFEKRGYDMRADTLYLMYNSHNLVIKNMPDRMAFELDEQIGYINYMHQKGYDNDFLTTGKNTYTKSGDTEIKRVMPTNELPETQSA
ncbi:MAG: hypothetical protein KA198_01000 [Chitinophagaceae bacterium]|nr:hypothetical protein [Chitinophagaceae bacterium]